MIDTFLFVGYTVLAVIFGYAAFRWIQQINRKNQTKHTSILNKH